MTQMAFYFDQTRCTGCYACAVACKDWNDIPAGPAQWRRITQIEEGEFPLPFVANLSAACEHCAEPVCAVVCPAGAITKRREDGVVAVDGETCLGEANCDLCRDACPYDAPQFGSEENAKMQKCDFCLDRLAEKKKPVCVDACPMHALDAGPIEELRAKYGDMREAEGFVYAEALIPSVVLKSKKDPKNLSVQKIVVAPATGSISS